MSHIFRVSILSIMLLKRMWPEIRLSAVTVTVVVVYRGPPQPATVYVMVHVPAATPVTTPDELTVATAGLLLLQVPPATTSNKLVVDPATVVVVPVIVPALAGASVT